MQSLKIWIYDTSTKYRSNLGVYASLRRNKPFGPSATVCTYHTDGGANGFRWQIFCELCPNDTTVSMRSNNFPPDTSDFGGLLVTLGNGFPVCTVDVRNAFAEVEVCVLSLLDSFNPDEGCVGVLVAKTTFVAVYNTLGV